MIHETAWMLIDARDWVNFIYLVRYKDDMQKLQWEIVNLFNLFYVFIKTFLTSWKNFSPPTALQINSHYFCVHLVLSYSFYIL